MNINYNALLKSLLPFVVVTLITFIIGTLCFIYLPKSGKDFLDDKDIALEFKRYDGFYLNENLPIKKESIKKATPKRKIETLSQYKLKGIYSTTSNGGWVIIENRAGTKSFILSQGEDLDSYTLLKLFNHYVVFTKNEKEYKLEMKSKKEKINYEISQTVGTVSEKIVVKDDSVKINRAYLNSYVNNIDKVWSNISIKELRKDGKIDGFKVNRVAKGSVFEKLGLKRGDIIKAINNSILNSYADAFKVYNNINKTKYLNIEVLRNNETMELNYEID